MNINRVYRAITFVDHLGLAASVRGYDRIVVDGIPYAKVLDRLEPIKRGEWYETRDAALRAGAAKLTGMASEMLKRAEEMREEAAGV